MSMLVNKSRILFTQLSHRIWMRHYWTMSDRAKILVGFLGGCGLMNVVCHAGTRPIKDPVHEQQFGEPNQLPAIVLW